jgi:ribosomal protein L11 methyltransferase
MYSLRLTCPSREVDLVSADLWELGTAGIQELDYEEVTVLIAGFESSDHRVEILNRFARYTPEWEQEDETDWVQRTHQSWPPREVGNRIFLAPVWFSGGTPPGRVRVTHNPGLACGTGEHPCSQLALMALEQYVNSTTRVVDVGAGSGILGIAARRLGASFAVGVDTDLAALAAARENFEANGMEQALVAGSADCLARDCSDLIIANISGTVLLSIMDEMVRITAPNGLLVLTGFTESELPHFQGLFPKAQVSGMNEWRCLVATLS